MKNPIIIANWKMKLTQTEAVYLAKKVAKYSDKYKAASLVLCPSFTDIALVSEVIKDTDIGLGAQDCFWEEKGAFTGEVSPKFLQDSGVNYVIVGHSERREHLNETEDMIHKKIRLLITLDINPILCVGETFDERQEGLKDVVLRRQLHSSLDGLWFNKSDRLIVAYEPVWVIGSGQDVDPEEIDHTHQVIRQLLYDLFPDNVVDNQMKIIYGGSVDPENVSKYLNQKTVHGALVGTASLDSSQFRAIVSAACKC